MAKASAIPGSPGSSAWLLSWAETAGVWVHPPRLSRQSDTLSEKQEGDGLAGVFAAPGSVQSLSGRALR